MPAPCHLLTLWNPSYSDDGLDTHLGILLHWDRERREGRADDEDVYVWWAKIRSAFGLAPKYGVSDAA